MTTKGRERGHRDILALDWTHWSCSSTAQWSCRPPPSTRGRSCWSGCCSANAVAAVGGNRCWHCQTDPAAECSHGSASGENDRHDVWTRTTLAAEPHCSSGRHWATQSAAGAAEIDCCSGNCCGDDSWGTNVLLLCWQSVVRSCCLEAGLRRSGMPVEDDGDADLRWCRGW